MEFASNKASSIDKLIAIIDNSDNTNKRLESIRNLSDVLGKNDQLFKILENLLISDSNEEIRRLAAEMLRMNFNEKSFEPMMWAIQHESSNLCLDIIFKSLIFHVENLKNLNENDLKSILIDYINKINDKEFKMVINTFFENNSLELIRYSELIEILFNFFSLTFLKKQYWRLKYSIEGFKVVELDFIFKGLSEIPYPIKYLKSIKKLSFRYNQITKLPDWCGTLILLEELDLSQNRLFKLPRSITQLSNLKILNLEGNEFTSLPDSISLLHSLEVLNIKSNSIEQISESLISLKSLRELHVGAYSLVKIPESIKEMENKGLKIFFESI